MRKRNQRFYATFSPTVCTLTGGWSPPALGCSQLSALVANSNQSPLVLRNSLITFPSWFLTLHFWLGFHCVYISCPLSPLSHSFHIIWNVFSLSSSLKHDTITPPKVLLLAQTPKGRHTFLGGREQDQSVMDMCLCFTFPGQWAAVPVRFHLHPHWCYK